jgi:hypothetical protein
MAKRDLLPTPTAADSKGSGAAGYPTDYSKPGGRHSGTTLTDALVRSWPTPSARDWRSGGSNLIGTNSRPLSEVAAGGDSTKRLNPAFVEWMMGWPIGWTDCERAVTESFRSWLRKLSCASRGNSD